MARRRTQKTDAANSTGLPEALRAGVEQLSGVSLDVVKVHRNSDRPAQLGALAYAQGLDIHVASGKDQNAPHEAWHVVQQTRGRVRPSEQLPDGATVSDDHSLEAEADRMGKKASKN